ncbi:MAG: tol-pal system protein YbgF [Candidatus Rokuibacteriota bacterium]
MVTWLQERIVRSGPVVGLALLAATAPGCGTGEKARREAEMAALVKQVEELRKGQDQMAKDVGKLAGEMRALDAQAAFLVGETKASATEREQVKQAIQQQDGALRGLRSALDETNQKVATLSVPPPASPAAKPLVPPPGREVSAEKLYATAMTSFRADEHGQAVLEFTELIDRFPRHNLAASAQYWIGEAYYRQRDFNQAATEFQKVPDLYPQSQPVAESLLKLGMCYRALHDLPRARETWARVVKSHPRTEAATQARALLASLDSPGRAPR